MNDASPNEPRFDETPESATRQVAASDWNRSEIEAQPEPPPPRERLFSRKVLIGWALFAVIAYFGMQIVGTALKVSVKEAVRSGVAASTSHTKERVVIQTPNGMGITIGRERPGPPARPAAPAVAAPAPAATTDQPPAGAPTIPPERTKR